MSDRGTVSVAFELTEVAQVVENARLILRLIDEDHVEDDMIPVACRTTAATLALVGARLRLLVRVLHGAVDPHVLAADFNERFMHDREPGDVDTLLTPWTVRRRPGMCK